MGLGGVLVRKVFFKNRNSDGHPDVHERHFGADKSKWSSVKHYFCGDEFNSIIAEDDFSSLRSTEAAVMQSVEKVSRDEEVSRRINQINKEEEKLELELNLSSQEKAAIVIQSAFRGFRVANERKQYKELKLLAKEDDGGEQSEATEALSTIVQVGDFPEALEAQEAIVSVPQRELRKARSQMYRIKEEWDDSTLSSNVLKLRIQNRLEAMTRRERALAYAFSQQLRACSKKKSSKSDSNDPGMGWSWLERWMATRPPENSIVDNFLSRHFDPIYNYKRQIVIKKRFDVAFEEKESCASNDVAISFHGSVEASQVSSTGYSPVKNMLKATKSVSKRKILSDYHQKKKVIKVGV
ncbi:protein IQ-DOMAIN 32 [Dendrobium catenatum]|nr:protein IQ-DOMAIN 32 [Dendrobium catenatum]